MKWISGAEFLRTMGEGRSEDRSTFEDAARPIVDAVRRTGDAAISGFTREFDGANLPAERFEVTPAEKSVAWSTVSDDLVQAITKARDNVAAFHEKAVPKSWFTLSNDGSLLGQVVRPLDRVGIYAPGGTAAYPSSVIMGAAPAKVAGVPDVILCTPPNKRGLANPLVLIAADICGVSRTFKIGGAQAVAAMAYGTATVPKVRKILGPGNAYVAAAKKLVYGDVAVDLPAGPSEVLIIASASADPDTVAADLLAQAEHDAVAKVVLVTLSSELADAVQEKIDIRIQDLPRRDIAAKALDEGGYVVQVGDIDEAIAVANAYGPEHLQLMVDDGIELLPRIQNAGSIFIGEWSPAAAGDYGVGPNHILPTGGAAFSFSALSASDFVKVSNVALLSRGGLAEVTGYAVALAEAEGLAGHARSLLGRACGRNLDKSSNSSNSSSSRSSRGSRSAKTDRSGSLDNVKDVGQEVSSR